MRIKNIGPIDYDNEDYDGRNGGKIQTINPYTPNNVWAIRCPVSTPTDFNHEQLTQYYGEDFVKNIKKVLEIGFGCGRNAQFWLKQTDHVQYYGFDASAVGMKYFKAQGFPEDRYHIALDIDDTILSQEYDLIYSTYVFHHIGFINSNEYYDSISIVEKLFPLLKKGGWWVSHEGQGGDNGFSFEKWMKDCFTDDMVDIKHKQPDILRGSVEDGKGHWLVVMQKK